MHLCLSVTILIVLLAGMARDKTCVNGLRLPPAAESFENKDTFQARGSGCLQIPRAICTSVP